MKQEIDPDKLRQLYKQTNPQLTYKEICQVMGFKSSATLYKKLKEVGLTPNRTRTYTWSKPVQTKTLPKIEYED